MGHPTPLNADHPVIETRGLRVRSGEFASVHDVSLSVFRGEIFGLVGPIGSGKSSLLKALAGIVPVDPGQVWINGLDVAVHGAAARAQVGYMPGYMGAYNDLLVLDYLYFFARACKVSAGESPGRIDHLLGLAGLADQRDQFIQTLGDEARHRLAVVKAAIHSPPVLIFDEPAIAIPVPARIRLKELIARLAAEGHHTVIMCSNILTDLIGLCQRMGVMHDGRLASSGPAESIAKRLTGARVLEIETAGPLDAMRALLAAHPAIAEVHAEGSRVVGSLSGLIENPGNVIDELIAQGAQIRAWREHQIDLGLLVSPTLEN